MPGTVGAPPTEINAIVGALRDYFGSSQLR